jgi:hypothetical protein
MNTNEPDLEKELRALRPITPSASLERRIAADLAIREIAVFEPRTMAVATSGVLVRKEARAPFLPWLRGLGWALTGATAAVALVWLWPGSREAQPESAQTVANTGSELFLPAESERELLDAEQSEILLAEGEEPVRQFRFRSIERYAWIEPDTGARVEVEVPREDVMLMPVAMQ